MKRDGHRNYRSRNRPEKTNIGRSKNGSCPKLTEHIKKNTHVTDRENSNSTNTTETGTQTKPHKHHTQKTDRHTGAGTNMHTIDSSANKITRRWRGRHETNTEPSENTGIDNAARIDNAEGWT